MAADGFGAVAGDQADDQAADHGDADDPRAQGIVGGRQLGEREFPIEKQVREEADHDQQDVRGDRAERADDGGEGGDAEQAGVA